MLNPRYLCHLFLLPSHYLGSSSSSFLPSPLFELPHCWSLCFQSSPPHSSGRTPPKCEPSCNTLLLPLSTTSQVSRDGWASSIACEDLQDFPSPSLLYLCTRTTHETVLWLSDVPCDTLSPCLWTCYCFRPKCSPSSCLFTPAPSSNPVSSTGGHRCR